MIPLQQPAPTTNSIADSDYCLTKVTACTRCQLYRFPPQGCINTAADLLNKLDQSANPCDNFYQFACGSFIEETVIPDDRTRTSMFSVLGDKLDVQVRGLLEGEIKPEEPKPFKMAKSVFQSCMDKETIEVGSCC